MLFVLIWVDQPKLPDLRLPGLKLFPPGPLVVQLLAAGSQGLDLLLQALDKSGISIKDESSLIILVIVSELYLSNLSL